MVQAEVLRQESRLSEVAKAPVPMREQLWGLPILTLGAPVLILGAGDGLLRGQRRENVVVKIEVVVGWVYV